MPAAPQLLGPAPAVQLVDLGRRHPVLEVPRRQPGQLLRDRGRSRWGRRTTSSSAWRSPPGCWRTCTGQDEEENFFKITTIAAQARRAQSRRHCRRLAPLQSLFRPRARRALHHVGRRRRLPASDARAEERHLGALARAPGRGGEPAARHDRRPAGRRLEGRSTTTSASSATPRRPEGVVEQAVQDVQDALEPLQSPARSRPSASASRSSRRRPNAIPSKASSYLLSLGNILFPFYNPGFAIGIGLLYWLDHLGVPDPRHALRDLRRQDRQPRHRHLARERAWAHAALSHPGHDRLDQPCRHAGRPLRHAGVVCRRRRLSGLRALPAPSSSSARRISWRI